MLCCVVPFEIDIQDIEQKFLNEIDSCGFLCVSNRKYVDPVEGEMRKKWYVMYVLVCQMSVDMIAQYGAAEITVITVGWPEPSQ